MNDDLPTPPPESATRAREATVFIPTPIHGTALDYAKERFGRVIAHDEMSLEDGLGVAHGILNRANPLPAHTIVLAPNLAAISVVGVGTDSIDLSACRERGIAVLNCPGSNAQPVAELTLTLILSSLRRVPELDRKLRDGERVLSIDHLGRGLAGKRVGLIGMGATARKVAELMLHAFNCPIHVFSPTSSPTKWTSQDPSIAAAPVPIAHTRHASLSTLLPSVDILCLHCPLTDQTRNLISTHELEMMRNDAVLVNMSRGAVVDEKALCRALKEGVIAGAASDVFDLEPAQRESMNGLMDCQNFFATPHIGGSTVEAQIEVCFLAIDQLADHFDGYQVRNKVC